MDKPLILCANDDGFFSKGLRVLADALSTFARVVVVAPESEQSASSHSLTLHRPLRLRRHEPDRYALDGTPADCVYLALHLTGERAVLPRKPDLVISGINRGINLGQDVFYSGTVAAAREGALRNIPAIAASVELKADHNGVVTFDPGPTAEVVAMLAQKLLARERIAGPTPLHNVNLPAGPLKGLVATRLGRRLWSDEVDVRVDPRGRTYFWLGGAGVSHDQAPGTDTAAFDQGLGTVTALSLDLGRDDEPARVLLDALVG